jgi:hypothetical protein
MGSGLSCKNDSISCSCSADTEKIVNYNVIIEEKNKTLTNLNDLYKKLDKKLERLTLEKEKMKIICKQENDYLEQTMKKINSSSDDSSKSDTEPYKTTVTNFINY